MLMLWLTSFLVSNPFEDFSWSKCFQQPAMECAQSIVNHSQGEAEGLLRTHCFDNKVNQACLTLGNLYALQHKDSLAVKPYSFACSHNLAEACVEAGYASERQGKEKEADDFYLYGCMALTHTTSCEALATNARERRDFELSYTYFKKACDYGKSESCLSTADTAIFTHKNSDDHQLKLYARACELDNAVGCYKAANLSKELGQKDKALEFLKESCLKKIDEACDEYKELNGGGMIMKPLSKKVEKTKGWIMKLIEYWFPLEEH